MALAYLSGSWVLSIQIQCETYKSDFKLVLSGLDFTRLNTVFKKVLISLYSKTFPPLGKTINPKGTNLKKKNSLNAVINFAKLFFALKISAQKYSIEPPGFFNY